MISLMITEVKPFMAKLLAQTAFDHFILREMELSTLTNFTIDGQLNEAFLSKEELEERGEHGRNILWSDVRTVVFSMIKGNKTPLSLKIVFQLPRKQSEELLQNLGGRIRAEELGGLYLNIRFEKNALHIITGTAIKTFTLDKTLEQEWDRRVREILKEQAIPFEEL
ncbi:hypothetical protein HNQ56_001669 [Anaerotaenia torta]|uniref:DUF5721 family protein n=1 Tax=Anaerotaenia torta TaxID=433293 RepID=UPI003D1EAB89